MSNVEVTTDLDVQSPDSVVNVTVEQNTAAIQVSNAVAAIQVQADEYALEVTTPTVGLVAEAPATTVTSVGTQGPQGPPGPQGSQGIQGPPGANGGIFVYTQTSPSATWVIQHNLGNYLPVTVVDTSGNEMEGTVSYLSLDTIQLDFSAPFSGTAVVN